MTQEVTYVEEGSHISYPLSDEINGTEKFIGRFNIVGENTSRRGVSREHWTRSIRSISPKFPSRLDLNIRPASPT